MGEDQAQHLEFTRELAIGFNSLYQWNNKPVFRVPKTMLSPAKRVMSLADPTKKMSKSDGNGASRILINDSKEDIYKKIKKAKTDSVTGISYDQNGRPGVSNLINLMLYFDRSGGYASPEEIVQDMQDMTMLALKEKVAETIDSELRDIRDRYNYFEHAPAEVRKDVVSPLRGKGVQKAQLAAKETLENVKRAIGLRVY